MRVSLLTRENHTTIRSGMSTQIFALSHICRKPLSRPIQSGIPLRMPIHDRIRPHTYAHLRICACVQVCMCTCMHVYMYACTRTRTRIMSATRTRTPAHPCIRCVIGTGASYTCMTEWQDLMNRAQVYTMCDHPRAYWHVYMHAGALVCPGMPVAWDERVRLVRDLFCTAVTAAAATIYDLC